jgi:FAD/FMN-containing dehydrogenase/Fe-S oxidoreductase
MSRIPLPQIAVPDRLRAVVDAVEVRDDVDVRFTRHDRMLYATDASQYQVEPLGVLVPHTVAAAIAIVKICARHEVPILPRGGGTSLAGQTVNEAVVLDCSQYLCSIGDVDIEHRTVEVEPGVVLDDLCRATAPFDLTFGPEVSTATHATLGGMIANCSAGLHSLVYGMTDEHLRAVDLVLADGRSMHLSEGASEHDDDISELTQRVVDIVLAVEDEIEVRYPKVRRNVGGYKLDRLLAQIRSSTAKSFDKVNLSQLVAGSEGTLGLVTGAVLDLVPVPAARGLAVLGYADVHSALETLTAILDTAPSAVELLDGTILSAAEGHESYRPLLENLPMVNGRRPGAVLYVDYFGDDEVKIQECFAMLQQAVPGASHVHQMDSEAQSELWKLRKVSLSLMSGVVEDRKPVGMLEDCVVPPERLADFQHEFATMLSQHDREATWYAHASVGLLHIRPRLDLREDEDRHILRQLAQGATAMVRRYGGSVSGEHGDGRARADMIRDFYGPVLMDAFRRIKAVFDPSGMCNPGFIDGTPDPMSDWRTSPGGSPLVAEVDEETFFDWSSSGGLVQATSACNGNGLCRSTVGGAMCPSYRATRDERHATRGRGNALRLAVTGQLGAEGGPTWDDADTLETLDLCLGCKACRYECPSHVDVAKLKAEYEAQRFRRVGRVPLRTRMVGHVRRINRLGSACAPLSNFIQRTPPCSWLIRGIMGIAPGRTMPRFARSVRSWARSRPHDPSSPTVLLLPDCFCTWGETDIAKSAIRLLEAFGYRVVLPDMGCCGRTMCSTGMLQSATRTIERSARQLGEAIEANSAVAVVGVEPSCVTTLQQEWLELRTDVDAERIKKIASMASTVEEFIVASWDSHPCRPSFDATDEAVLLHVHCHQKPRGGQVADFLRRCGYSDVALLDSGCCGMAGSFGYAKEHHALSLEIAEQSLGSALRTSPDAIVAANGTSCRHQVLDVFQREGVHPVVLSAARLQM